MANFTDTFTGSGFLSSLSGSQVSGGMLENQQPNHWASPLDSNNSGHIQLGSISSTDSLSCAGHAITIAGWVRKDSTSSVVYQRVFDKATGSNALGGYGLYVDKSNGAVYVACSGANTFSTSSPFEYNGKWQHVLGTIDGTNFRVYVNGELTKSAARIGYLPPATTANAAIGARDLADDDQRISNEWEGDISRVFIYSGVMSDYDISQSYMTATIPENQTGLQLVQGWKLDNPTGGAGTTVNPYTGTTHTGTLIGADSDIVSGRNQTIGVSQTESLQLGTYLTGDGPDVSGASAITNFSGVWSAKPGASRAAVQFSADDVVWKSATGTPVVSGAYFFDGIDDTINTSGVIDAKTISFWVYSMQVRDGDVAAGNDAGHIQAKENYGIITLANDVGSSSSAMEIRSDGNGIVRFDDNGSSAPVNVYVDGIKDGVTGVGTPTFQSRLLYRKWQHIAVVKPT